ncbi:MAG: DUF447 domain-containing protein [Methanobacterium sp.]
MLDLNSIGMKKGLLYETVITTKNAEGIPNAAPIGVTCKNKCEIVLYLFEGTHTLQNIKLERTFMVNILNDPAIFVESTLGELSSKYFKKYGTNFFIENTQAFFSAKVTGIKKVDKKDDIGKSALNIVNASVDEIIIKNKDIEPLNRAIYAILESLVYVSRIDMVDRKAAEEYAWRIKEMSRLVNRTGGKEHKEAMKQILRHLNGKN